MWQAHNQQANTHPWIDACTHVFIQELPHLLTHTHRQQHTQICTYKSRSDEFVSMEEGIFMLINRMCIVLLVMIIKGSPLMYIFELVVCLCGAIG